METKDDWKLTMKNIRDLMQEHFDNAVSGMLLQGKRSAKPRIDGSDICVYRKESGDEVLYCAVGQLIKNQPQHKIDVIEGIDAFDIFRQDERMFIHLFLEDNDYTAQERMSMALMLQSLQEAHDESDGCDFRSQFFYKAKEVAEKHIIVFNFDSDDWF